MFSAGGENDLEPLIERAGIDPNALDELLAIHRQYLRRLIDLRLDDDIRRRVDPSDVIQETQMIASQRFQEFLKHRPASFRLWLRRKAIDLLVELRRKHVLAEKRTVRREVAMPDRSSIQLVGLIHTGSPSASLQRRELTEQVQMAIRGLKDVDREILLLRHAEELTNAEVADLLEVDVKAASKRYGRALGRLRKELIEMGVFSAHRGEG